MAQDPRTEDPRNQDLKDFAKAKTEADRAWMWMNMPLLMAARNPSNSPVDMKNIPWFHKGFIE